MKRTSIILIALISWSFNIVVRAQDFTASPVGEGEYYLYNVGTGAYLTHGNGTATALKVKGGIPFNLKKNGDCYDIVMGRDVFVKKTTTVVTENVNDHNVYLDVPVGGYADYKPWRFEAVEGKENTYYIRHAGNNRYLENWTSGIGYSFRSRTSSTAHGIYSQWKLVTANNRLAGATDQTPKDATFLVKVPDLINTTSVNAVWQKTGDINVSGGTNDFRVAEAFNQESFDFHQIIEGAPAGTYVLTVNAFYRYGDINGSFTAHSNNTEKLDFCKLYATTGEDTQESNILSIYADAGQNSNIGATTSAGVIPNGMTDASAYFYAGCYGNNQVVITVPEGKSLTIGIKKNGKTDSDWLCFSNFRLTYYGPEPTGFIPKDFTGHNFQNFQRWDGNSAGYNASTLQTRLREEYSVTNRTGNVMTQTITGLDNGVYEAIFLANASYTSGREYKPAYTPGNGGSGAASVFAGDKSQDVMLMDVGNNGVDFASEYMVSNVVVTDHTLTLGLRKDLDGTNWHILRLKSLRLVGAPDLSVFKAAYEAALEKANSAYNDAEIPAGFKVALKQVIDTYASVPESQAAYENAETALLAAVADAELGKGSYKFYLHRKSAVNTVINQTDVYYDDGTAKSELDEDIASIQTAVDTVTTVEGINEQTDALLGAIGRFVNATGMVGKYFDLTCLLYNPDFEISKDAGWNYNGTAAFNYMTGNTFNAIEFFHGTYNLSQTLKNMPSGTYRVLVNGYYRPDNEYAPGNHKQENVTGYVYANDAKEQLAVLRDNLTDISRAHELMNQGEYLNEVAFDMAEGGNLVLGVKCEEQLFDWSWTFLDDFRLLYTVEDFSKTITASKMATMYLDYATVIPEAEEGQPQVKVYVAEDNGQHDGVLLTKITDGIVPANTGVILYADVNEDAKFRFAPTTATGSAYPTNCLKGVTEKTAYNEVDGYDNVGYAYYAMMLKETQPAFYHVSSGSYAANTAYLVLPRTSDEIKSIGIVFNDADAIECISVQSTTNDNLNVYNLSGQKVAEMQRGRIYIVNGKKCFNK